MNPVVHFEMPAEDRKRMADFYTKVFGWKAQQLGEDMGNYVLATTTDSDEKGTKKPGAINEGFFHKDDDKPAQYPSLVIEVIKEYTVSALTCTLHYPVNFAILICQYVEQPVRSSFDIGYPLKTLAKD